MNKGETHFILFSFFNMAFPAFSFFFLISSSFCFSALFLLYLAKNNYYNNKKIWEIWISNLAASSMRRTWFFSPPLLFFPCSAVEFAFGAGLGRPGVLFSPAVFLKKFFSFLFGNLVHVSAGSSPALPPAAGAAPVWIPGGPEILRFFLGWASKRRRSREGSQEGRRFQDEKAA